MNTAFFSQAKRPSIAKLLWAGAAVLAFASMGVALSVPEASGAHRVATTPSTNPAVMELNRIDHSQIDWDKVPAHPEEVGSSIAADAGGT